MSTLLAHGAIINNPKIYEHTINFLSGTTNAVFLSELTGRVNVEQDNINYYTIDGVTGSSWINIEKGIKYYIEIDKTNTGLSSSLIFKMNQPTFTKIERTQNIVPFYNLTSDEEEYMFVGTSEASTGVTNPITNRRGYVIACSAITFTNYVFSANTFINNPILYEIHFSYPIPANTNVIPQVFVSDDTYIYCVFYRAGSFNDIRVQKIRFSDGKKFDLDDNESQTGFTTMNFASTQPFTVSNAQINKYFNPVTKKLYLYGVQAQDNRIFVLDFINKTSTSYKPPVDQSDFTQLYRSFGSQFFTKSQLIGVEDTLDVFGGWFDIEGLRGGSATQLSTVEHAIDEKNGLIYTNMPGLTTTGNVIAGLLTATDQNGVVQFTITNNISSSAPSPRNLYLRNKKYHMHILDRTNNMDHYIFDIGALTGYRRIYNTTATNGATTCTRYAALPAYNNKYNFIIWGDSTTRIETLYFFRVDNAGGTQNVDWGLFRRAFGGTLLNIVCFNRNYD